MQYAYVVNRDATRFYLNLFRRRIIKIWLGHASSETTILVVIQYPILVGTGNGQQATVFLGHIIHTNANSQ